MRLTSTKNLSVNIFSTKRSVEREASKEISDIFSASDDDETSPIISYESQSPGEEKNPTKNVAIKSPVNSKAESKNSASGFTGTEWLKKLTNKQPGKNIIQ